MTMENIVSNGTTSITPSDKRSMTNLLVDLKKMGIDPQPYFILAAREFENIYGENAAENATRLHANAINSGNDDDAYIWHQIFTLLSDNSPNSLRNIH
ncbi:hypothetical protein [Emcibacter nanhaiensis]|uniref:Uncharacterized protein n=1 Tax=Emcibacter nanhaiensis TaxID=1505037 RepID=A0A501PHA2_9PROT|nr:hypothetical protein [Emcibacter nanhaiensis]TPD59236.1 hypothetical protein FIV46_13485 [Emcibacter nanhaiensis]